MSDVEKFVPPKSEISDKAYTLVRAAVSSIPVVGNAAVEFFSALVAPPLEHRRLLWMEEIANSLRILEENRQITLSDLQSNEIFITTLVQASEAAVRNHQHEKIQALRNAVINSAIGIDIEEDLQLVFIRFINELTPSHFSLLRFFRDNEEDFRNAKSYEVLFQAFTSHNPTSIQQEEFKLLCADLTARVLLRISSTVEDFNDVGEPNYLTEDSNIENKPLLRVTDIGKKLLEFVSINN